MGNSSVLGVQKAATRPAGVDADALGPSDNSDSGSDRIGADVGEGVDPLGVSGEPADEASDISVDRVVGGEGLDDDEDPDLGFVDEAEASDPFDGEQQAREGDDPTDDAMARPRL